MKLLLAFALISLAAAYPADEPKKNCDELTKLAETGLRQMFVVDSGKIPSNIAEVTERCNEGKKLYKSLLEYKTCLKPFPAQILGASTQSIGQLLKKNCGDEAGRKNILNIVQCVNEDKLKHVQACTIGSLDVLKMLSESNDAKAVLLPKLCCLGHITGQCATSRLESVTCADPTVSPKKHIEEILNALQKDSMELACEEYKNAAACEAKIPGPVAEMKAAVNGNTATAFGDRSLIQPLLKVSEKIAN